MDFVSSDRIETTDQLNAMLEASLSSSNIQSSEDESAIFDDSIEPSSTGVISLIRKMSLSRTNDVSSIEASSLPINGDDTNSYHSADDESISRATSSNRIEFMKMKQDDVDLTREDDNFSTLLKSKLRHLFILSENGKPVYSRYGDEDEFVTLMGVMQTLVSFSEMTDSNQLQYIKAGRCHIAFLHREPLVLVLISHTHEHPLCLMQQLTYTYQQIISTLTLSRLKHKFSNQPNFDLRRWLSNAEKKLINSIIDMYENDLGMLMTCAKCLILPSSLRSQIGQTVASIIKGQKEMTFAIVLAHGQLVSIARLKSHHLHPSDLCLLINLVKSSDAFKGVESWVPVCLPRFNSDGCFHIHISYLDDECNVCLLLLTTNPEHFQILSDFKQRIVEKFKKNNFIAQIHLALEKDRLLNDEISCPELRYFAYKSRALSQYTSSKLLAPYNTKDEQCRLFQTIRYIYGRLHDPTHQFKIVYHTGEQESLLGWLAPGFEIHAVFSPLTTLETVNACIDRILMFIKREETQLFLMRCEHF